MSATQATTVNEAVISELARQAHKIAQEKGFWDQPDPFIAEACTKLLLISTEVSEATEALRDSYRDGPPHQYTGLTEKQSSDFIEELADIVIRTFDLAASLQGMAPDLGVTIIEKMATNRQRPQKHSKRF